ncbi:MAG: hypothetical protein WCQ61_06880, partial [Proteiniphilum sp.]
PGRARASTNREGRERQRTGMGESVNEPEWARASTNRNGRERQRTGMGESVNEPEWAGNDAVIPIKNNTTLM